MMNDFETILCCLLIPFAYATVYICGKNDVIHKLIKRLEKNFNNCSHEYRIVSKSNALQLDSMGYPLRLCICECEKCGNSKQMWLDVPKDDIYELDSGSSFLMKWQKQ